MNRKPQKKSSLNSQGSQENLVFSLPSIKNLEKKPKDSIFPSNNNYNFINVDYQKRLSCLFSSGLSESEKVKILMFFSKKQCF